jgi:hypothetical protein
MVELIDCCLDYCLGIHLEKDWPFELFEGMIG